MIDSPFTSFFRAATKWRRYFVSCWGPSLWPEGGRLVHPGQEGGGAGDAGRRSGLKRLSGERSYRGGAGGVDCFLIVVLLLLARFFFFFLQASERCGVHCRSGLRLRNARARLVYA